MELAGTPLSENFPIAYNVEKIDKLKFGAADTISLVYRVNSTSGDVDCVEPGIVTTHYTITQYYIIVI